MKLRKKCQKMVRRDMTLGYKARNHGALRLWVFEIALSLHFYISL